MWIKPNQIQIGNKFHYKVVVVFAFLAVHSGENCTIHLCAFQMVLSSANAVRLEVRAIFFFLIYLWMGGLACNFGCRFAIKYKRVSCLDGLSDISHNIVMLLSR